MTINLEIFSDAVKVGLANVVFMSLIMKAFPNNLPAQMFIGASLLHITTEMLRVKNEELELSEYNKTN
jgi:hypothetical protein